MNRLANGNFGGGDGSALLPYLVEDAADLNAVRNNLFAHYKQTAHIDLGVFENWIPIGGYLSSDETAFGGCYDGGNFYIDNLKCHAIASHWSNGWDIGLFAKVGGTDVVLQNIHLRNFDISNAYDYAGALIGFMTYVQSDPLLTVENCTAENGKIMSDYSVGGLFGFLAGRSALNNCHVKNVAVNNYSWASYMGGLGGWCGDNVSMERCSFEGTIAKADYATGGLFGVIKTGTNSIVKNCYAITGHMESECIGGLFGEAFTWGNSETLTIEKSYFKGSIVGEYGTGGIAGMGGICIIKDCFVLASSINGIDYVNDIIGDPDNPYSTFDNNYVLDTLANVTQASGRVSQTQSLLQKTYVDLANWDFKNVWEIKPGQTPTFRKKRTIIKCKRVPLTNYRR